MHLPPLISKWNIDLALVNGENAADGGFGITEEAYEELLAAGADAVTLGNHTWNRKETLAFIEHAPRLIRPINYLPGTPGCGSAIVVTKSGRRALVINALGRLFMEPIENPFRAIDRELKENQLGRTVDAVVVDFHGEATGEKQAAGHFCDGRVSLLVGTHTHVPTADYRVLPHGTAYITDAGMTGDYDSVIGMDKHEPILRFTTGIAISRFAPAMGGGTMSGVAVETDDVTGLAIGIAPVRLGGTLEIALPPFWIES